MTVQPVLPTAALIAIAIALIAIRVVALYRLIRTGYGHNLRVLARWAGLTVVMMLLVVAAGRPGIPVSAGGSDQLATAGPAADVNVFFVVDRSVDSRVQDLADQASRMAGIRADMAAVIAKYPGARFAVIGFSAHAAVDRPLSDDVWSLKPFVQGLTPYIDALPDAVYQVDAAAANDLLEDKLAQAAQQFPGSRNLVFYFGEGAGGSHVPQKRFELPTGSMAGGAVLGYGTDAGGPIPGGWVDGNLVSLRDPQTDVVLTSAINESALKAIAHALNVPYLHRQVGQAIAPALPSRQQTENSDGAAAAVSVVPRVELYWVFTLVAAVLLLIEIYLSWREMRCRRRITWREVTS